MKKVFLYYYCDEWTSVNSKRLKMIFADTIKGRKALAEIITNDAEDGVIDLEIPSYLKLVNTCINQTPIFLNDYMTYGFIESECVEG